VPICPSHCKLGSNLSCSIGEHCVYCYRLMYSSILNLIRKGRMHKRGSKLIQDQRVLDQANY